MSSSDTYAINSRNRDRVRFFASSTLFIVDRLSLKNLQEQAKRIDGYVIIAAIRPIDPEKPELGLEACQLKIGGWSCDGPEGPKSLIDNGFRCYIVLREEVHV